MWAILAQVLTGPIVDAAVGVFGKYLQAGVDKEKIKAEFAASLGGVFRDVSKSNNEASRDMFVAFQKTLQTAKVVQYVWAYWVASQITFIIWLQIGVPFISYKFGVVYPGVGALDQWAYAGIMGALGLGPLVIKHTMTPPKL
jgi:hypothetical protein